jgi:hypothetical protein
MIAGIGILFLIYLVAAFGAMMMLGWSALVSFIIAICTGWVGCLLIFAIILFMDDREAHRNEHVANLGERTEGADSTADI